jgi:hypothetical protein
MTAEIEHDNAYRYAISAAFALAALIRASASSNVSGMVSRQ